MAHANVTQLSARATTSGTSIRRQSQVVKRRRLLVLALGVLLIFLAVGANYSPLRSYLDARARFADASAGITELSAQKADLQAELARLSEADYLESLARQELSYARPDEELYIVTQTDAGLDVVIATDGTPGFMERVLAPILD